jgi:hypothetical protein
MSRFFVSFDWIVVCEVIGLPSWRCIYLIDPSGAPDSSVVDTMALEKARSTSAGDIRQAE